jgi:hypothetical protein
MRKINFTLQLATLLPEFIFQFLLNGHIEQDSITCIELEDLRDALKSVHDPEMDDIKKFLSMENKAEEDETARECGDGCDHEHGMEHDHGPKPLEQAMDEVDGDLEEVDSEFYHKYTPAELKYIFEKIVYYIEKVYKYYLNYSEINLTLTVGFVMDGGLEANMAVEFFQTGVIPETIDDAYYMPVKNAMVSDDIALRVYFYYDKEKESRYDAIFSDIADIMNVKHEDRYKGGLQ